MPKDNENSVTDFVQLCLRLDLVKWFDKFMDCEEVNRPTRENYYFEQNL